MKNANYRKHNDGSHNSSTYHKKDGTNIRPILKTESKKEIEMSQNDQSPDLSEFFELVDQAYWENKGVDCLPAEMGVLEEAYGLEPDRVQVFYFGEKPPKVFTRTYSDSLGEWEICFSLDYCDGRNYVYNLNLLPQE